MIFDLGPFRLYRVEEDGTLDVSLKAFDDYTFGWEYGWRDSARGEDRPCIELRIGKMRVLYFERHEKGFEIWLFGFWWIK